MTKEDVLDLLWSNPIEIGHWVGFKDLTEMHNEWLKMFLFGTEDETLQAHRGSYKTTTLSLFLALYVIIRPNDSVMFFRKTGNDVTEVIRQTTKILQSGCIREIVKILYKKELVLLKASGSEIQTNLSTSIRGSSQIVGLGIYTSITGKHANIIVTDDIVNISDRISTAEREHTKLAYQELQNIKNRGGRFINTGTPWHKEDCFSLMPNPIKYDCYNTGLISGEELDHIKQHMSPSLFAANYELKHIASEDVIFTEPKIGADSAMIRYGIAHLDSAFYGEDYTAFSIMTHHDGMYYLFGKCWRKHVEDCYPEIYDLYNKFLCSKMYTEKNADKGMVARDFKNMGVKTVAYDENTNKHIKIVTYLKAIWPELIFVDGTDPEYIEQICEYNESAPHDDAPDSASCLARIYYPKIEKQRKREKTA